jgi:hypothetical protein
LLISTVTSGAAAASASMDAWSVISSGRGTTRGSLLGFGSRAVAYTFATPRSSRSSTIALPMPRCPPVIRTTAPSSEVI